MSPYHDVVPDKGIGVDGRRHVLTMPFTVHQKAVVQVQQALRSRAL